MEFRPQYNIEPISPVPAHFDVIIFVGAVINSNVTETRIRC